MYVGPPIDDPEMLERLPSEYRELLARANGYVAYHGGLHVRGACLTPEWHSLRAAWDSERALHRLWLTVSPDDVPFAQDALGDQFILRCGQVHRLAAETGEIESPGVDLVGFDAAVRADPVEYLNLAPLEAFRAAGGVLQPGQLLSVYPPYCVDAADALRSFRAIAAADRLGFLSSLAAQLRALPDGTAVKFDIQPPAS
jgi:hypothetical protein